MDIKYLQILVDNPRIKVPDAEAWWTNEPLDMQEIEALEVTYNGGLTFPTSLRELLYVAGGSCYVLDYAGFGSQNILQQKARSCLTMYGRNFSITRPYFVIDVYNYGDQFLFVYLDEGGSDPMVYQALLDEDEDPWITSLGRTLSRYIESTTRTLLMGYNPF